MRIAFFSDFSLGQVSGISDALRILMPALEQRGHTVRLYAPSVGKEHEGDEKLSLFRIRSIGIPGAPDLRLATFGGILRDLRTFKPDLLHLQACGTVGLWALIASRRLHVPLVGTDHTLPDDYLRYLYMDFPGGRWFVKRVISWFFQRCNVVTAPSQAVLDDLKAYGLTRTCRVFSNPFDTSHFRPLPDKKGLKERFGLAPLAVLSFGRLAAEKNLGETLKSFALVVQKMPEAQLVFIGDGAKRQVLEQEAKQLGIADRTRFLGYMRGSELAEAINATDVALITSRSETQSLTTLQEMSCGLPVVGVRAGALPEYILDGETGFIVEPGDTKGCADRLVTLLRDPALRATMGNRGMATVQQFSPATIAAEVETLYQNVLTR